MTNTSATKPTKPSCPERSNWAKNPSKTWSTRSIISLTSCKERITFRFRGRKAFKQSSSCTCTRPVLSSNEIYCNNEEKGDILSTLNSVWAAVGTIQRRCLPCHWFLFRTQWSRWNQHSKISDLPKSNGFNQISTLCNHATLMPTTMTRVPGDNSCDHFMLLPKGHLSKHLWGHHSAGRSTRIYTSTSHGNINTSPRMIYRDPP